MLSCTLPCTNHVVVEDLELIHHVPKLKVREHSGRFRLIIRSSTAACSYGKCGRCGTLMVTRAVINGRNS